MVRILIVDDKIVIRKMIRDLLKDEEGWEVCGESEDGEEAVRHAETLRPHVIILDIQMPVMDGLAAARIILQTSPQTLILIISFHDSAFLFRESKACGAKGFLPKHQFAEHLVPAVRTLLRGELHFPNGPMSQGASL
jgi:DNA-binding NarL/FixJ family response regulator